jgi:hypothetical protein
MIFFRILILLFLYSTTFARDAPTYFREAPKTFAYEENQESSFYLHPFSLVLSIPFAALKINPIPIYLTGEFPIGRQSAIITNPSLLVGEIDELTYFRIGSGIGIRSFLLSDKDYIQLMTGAYYRNAKVNGYKNHSGFMADLLFYIGIKPKNSIVFGDVGGGIEYRYWNGNLRAEVFGEDKFFSHAGYQASKGFAVSWDFNLGIRLPWF